MSDQGEKTCPLCAELMDLTDQQLKPCKCGYEICVWCWNRIMDMAEKDDAEGNCPACRATYDKEKIVGMAAKCTWSADEIKSDKKLKSHKSMSKAPEAQKDLTNIRVIKTTLVWVVGIPSELVDEDLLQRKEYFGQYGKVLKVSISRASDGTIQYSVTNTCSVYITYSKMEEAIRCIRTVHSFNLEGSTLRACFGTTKYCHAWLRTQFCNNPDCLYLHDIASQEYSFNKDETLSVEHKNKILAIIGPTNISQHRFGSTLPPACDDYCSAGPAFSDNSNITVGPNSTSIQIKGSPPDISTGRSLPATASWGLQTLNGKPPTPSSVLNKPKTETIYGFHPSVVSNITQGSVPHSDTEKDSSLVSVGRADFLPLKSPVAQTIQQSYPEQLRETKSTFPLKDKTVVAQTLQQSYPEQLRETISTLPLRESFAGSDSVPRKNSDVRVEITSKCSQDSSTAEAKQAHDFNEHSLKVSDDRIAHNRVEANLISFASQLGKSEGNETGSFAGLKVSDDRIADNEVETNLLSFSCPLGKSEGNETGNFAGLDYSGCSNLHSQLHHSIYMQPCKDDIFSNCRSSDVDLGESTIISSILSLDLDDWEDSMTSPHNLAKLLSKTDKQLELSNQWKVQNNNQSRFSFARQDEFTDQNSGLPSTFDKPTPMKVCSSQDSVHSAVDRIPYFDKLPNGLPQNIIKESDAFLNSHSIISPNTHSVSRAPVSAPPGFSSLNRPPPPGFSSHERMERPFDSISGNNSVERSSLTRNQYVNGYIGNSADELHDPAVLAVSKGTCAYGLNTSGIDIRSPLKSQLGDAESDPRLQMLLQQSISTNQNNRFSNRFGDGLSHFGDAYRSHSRLFDQSQANGNFSTFAHQRSRSGNLSSNHWADGWNNVQTRNDLGVAELLKNERLGFTKRYPSLEDLSYRIPSKGDIYNRPFGM